MKKALIISIIILVISSIAFGISVAVTGVREGQGFGVSIGDINVFDIGKLNGTNATKAGDVLSYSFGGNTINDIEISTTAAETNVSVGDVSEATVVYSTETGGLRFKAYLDGDELVIIEEGGFLLHIFNFGEHKAKLEVILPEKEYGDVEINTASGETKIEGLICNDFESEAASGNSEYNIFANNINVSTASGCVDVFNCTDRTANKITLDSVSGIHSLNGFRTNEFKLDNVSGTINVTDISGAGEADVVSGNINITYAEWNADLKLDAVSGEFDIVLPENAGVIVDLEAVSGGVDIDLTSEESTGTMTSHLSSESTSGILGGTNVHNISVDLVSGDVSIHN